MTNAIEQSKREMYDRFNHAKQLLMSQTVTYERFEIFETFLESYLELLRQDHEALHETARKRFDDIQSLEAVNAELQISLENLKTYNSRQAATIGSADEEIADLEGRLAKVTEERDLLRNRQQASDHAQGEATEKVATVHQSSGENVSCANTGSSAAILVAAIDLCKRQVELWGSQEIKAKKAMRRIAQVMNGDPDLADALRAATSPDTYATWLLNNDKCMHSFPSGEQCVFCGVGK